MSLEKRTANQDILKVLSHSNFPGRCVSLSLTSSLFEFHQSQGSPLPGTEGRAPWLPQRLLLGNAQDVELDGSGRVLIAPELRNASGMTRDVMLLGLGAHFELWDAATLASREAEDLAKGMPDVLNQFSF